MSEPVVVDLFAGPGGWDSGYRAAGGRLPVVGIEQDVTTCRTATDAGHARICADVATYPAEAFASRVDGLIASPPCQGWSTAGDRRGERDKQDVFTRITAYARQRQPDQVEWADERSPLTAEPMRYAAMMRPRWIALEQAPTVLPLWRHMAALLRELGYSTWAGVLSAERYGVAQTRRRAVLIARRDGYGANPPLPTYQPYEPGLPETVPDLFGDALPPPVSIAEALGWAPITTRDGHLTLESPARRKLHDRTRPREISDPATTVAFGQSDMIWTMRNGNQSNACARVSSDPAGTLFFGQRSNAVAFHDEWGETRRVTVTEAGLLQSFPADYPWCGTQSQRYRQIGDAVPPTMAAAILDPLVATEPDAAAAPTPSRGTRCRSRADPTQKHQHAA